MFNLLRRIENFPISIKGFKHCQKVLFKITHNSSIPQLKTDRKAITKYSLNGLKEYMISDVIELLEHQLLIVSCWSNFVVLICIPSNLDENARTHYFASTEKLTFQERIKYFILIYSLTSEANWKGALDQQTGLCPNFQCLY